jgi:hypothetical protein
VLASESKFKTSVQPAPASLKQAAVSPDAKATRPKSPLDDNTSTSESVKNLEDNAMQSILVARDNWLTPEYRKIQLDDPIPCDWDESGGEAKGRLVTKYGLKEDHVAWEENMTEQYEALKESHSKAESPAHKTALEAVLQLYFKTMEEQFIYASLPLPHATYAKPSDAVWSSSTARYQLLCQHNDLANAIIALEAAEAGHPYHLHDILWLLPPPVRHGIQAIDFVGVELSDSLLPSGQASPTGTPILSYILYVDKTRGYLLAVTTIDLNPDTTTDLKERPNYLLTLSRLPSHQSTMALAKEATTAKQRFQSAIKASLATLHERDDEMRTKIKHLKDTMYEFDKLAYELVETAEYCSYDAYHLHDTYLDHLPETALSEWSTKTPTAEPTSNNPTILRPYLRRDVLGRMRAHFASFTNTANTAEMDADAALNTVSHLSKEISHTAASTFAAPVKKSAPPAAASIPHQKPPAKLHAAIKTANDNNLHKQPPRTSFHPIRSTRANVYYGIPDEDDIGYASSTSDAPSAADNEDSNNTSVNNESASEEDECKADKTHHEPPYSSDEGNYTWHQKYCTSNDSNKQDNNNNPTAVKRKQAKTHTDSCNSSDDESFHAKPDNSDDEDFDKDADEYLVDEKEANSDLDNSGAEESGGEPANAQAETNDSEEESDDEDNSLKDFIVDDDDDDDASEEEEIEVNQDMPNNEEAIAIVSQLSSTQDSYSLLKRKHEDME